MLRVLPAVLALLLLICLGTYLLVDNALKQDADVQQRSRTFIARSIEQVRNEMGRNIINYSKWGEAYKNLHTRVNEVWANEQRNVGDIPFALYGYDGALVIGPQGRTVYAVIQGKPSSVQASDWIEGDLDGLLAAARDARNEETSVVRALRVNGTPALAAAATITPGWDPAIERTPGAASVMMFVTVLDAARLAVLSDSYGMPPLSLSPSAPPKGLQSMPLLDSATQVHWRAPTPGRALLRQTLPIFIAGVLALSGVLFMLLRHALASARQVDAQIDALHATQAGLTHSEQRFRDIAEASSDWLWEVDAQGRLTYLSERFTQVTGEPRDHWLGRPLSELLQPSAETPLPDWLAQANAPGRQSRETLLCHYRDHGSRQRVCKITSRAIAGGAGHRGTATDITNEMQAQARVLHLSLHDWLTDLPNRLQLQQFLASQLGAHRQPVAVLCLDLDRFKPVNDAWGHAFGDLLLQQVASRLRAQTPAGGMAARLGGDEFVVVLPGERHVEAIEQLCAQLVQALGQPFTLQAQAIHIGTSIGIALAPEHALDPAELLRKADIALYQAKNAGRSTWRIYDRAMDALLRRP